MKNCHLIFGSRLRFDLKISVRLVPGENVPSVIHGDPVSHAVVYVISALKCLSYETNDDNDSSQHNLNDDTSPWRR